MVIGLTGGSGSGKTTALTVLREMGAVCFDADEIYHELLKTDRALLARIGEAFPGAVEGGVLQRKKLGALVFADGEALRRLTALTQPAVRREIEGRLPIGGLAVIDAIGLFESGLDTLCDLTVAVTAPKEARVRRLMAREGVSRDYALARIEAQRPDEEFSALCDVTLPNDGSQEEFRHRCRAQFEKLIKETKEDGRTHLRAEKRL